MIPKFIQNILTRETPSVPFEPSLLILQWGEARSIVYSIDQSDYFIITNEYLMELDELGVIA